MLISARTNGIKLKKQIVAGLCCIFSKPVFGDFVVSF